MKRIAAALFFVATLLGPHANAEEFKANIATIDMKILVENHWRYPSEQAKLKEETDRATEEMKKLEDEGKSLVEKLKNLDATLNSPILSEEAKSATREQMKTISRDLNQKRALAGETASRLRGELQQKKGRAQADMIQEIFSVVRTYAKEQGYTLVLDKSDSLSQVTTVLYAADEHDITKDVVKVLNKGHESTTADSTVATPKEPAKGE